MDTNTRTITSFMFQLQIPVVNYSHKCKDTERVQGQYFLWGNLYWNSFSFRVQQYKKFICDENPKVYTHS